MMMFVCCMSLVSALCFLGVRKFNVIDFCLLCSML